AIAYLLVMLMGLGLMILATLGFLNLLLIPIYIIIYFFSGNAYLGGRNFWGSLQDGVSGLNNIGIENVYFMYMTFFFGIIVIFLITFSVLLGIATVLARFSSNIYDKKEYKGINDNEDTFMSISIYLIPFAHFFFKDEERQFKEEYQAADYIYSNKGWFLEGDLSFKDDFKKKLYHKYGHETSEKVGNFFCKHLKHIDELEVFLKTDHEGILNNELLKKACYGERSLKNTWRSSFLRQDYLEVNYTDWSVSWKDNIPNKDLVIEFLRGGERQKGQGWEYLLPWYTKRGYDGYFLTKSILRVTSYVIAILLWIYWMT
ncbi:MAG: hypothetical protein HRT73_13945, partial [Flavobacteriales bacterium]|nr:hypothetical protein [Flavobacteriales bacterium]